MAQRPWTFEEIKEVLPDLRTADQFVQDFNVEQGRFGIRLELMEDKVFRAINNSELEQLMREGSSNFAYHKDTNYMDWITAVTYIGVKGNGVLVVGEYDPEHFKKGGFYTATKTFVAPVQPYYFTSERVEFCGENAIGSFY